MAITDFTLENSGGGGGANTLYSADGNILAGVDRVATIDNTATLTFAGASASGDFVIKGGHATAIQSLHTDASGYNFFDNYQLTIRTNISGTPSNSAFFYATGKIQLFNDVGIGGIYGANTRLRIVGSGSTNATTSLLIENSSASQMFNIYDDGSFEFGIGASIINDTSIAIGNNAKATQISSIAIGKEAGNTTTSQYSIAIGNISNTGLFGVAIGYNSTAFANGTAIGSGATTTATASVSLGQNSNSGLRSIAIGYGTSVAGQNSVGIGYDADCSTSGVAIGGGIQNTGSYSIVLGSVAYNQTRTNTNTHSFSVFTEDATPLIQIHRDNDSWIDSTGSLGINTMTPDASSLMDLTSTTKGFLQPRMTGAEVEAIGSPATGLQVYATSAGAGDVIEEGWWGYDGTDWVQGFSGGGTTLYSGDSILSGARNVDLNFHTLGFTKADGGISIGTATADSSAILELSSDTKGFLPTRMSTSEINLIGTPAKGLMVYDTDTDQWMGNNGTPGSPNWVIIG